MSDGWTPLPKGYTKIDPDEMPPREITEYEEPHRAGGFNQDPKETLRKWEKESPTK